MNVEAFNNFVKRLKLFQPFPSVYDPISGISEFGPYGATIKANLVNTMRGEYKKAKFWEVDCPLISPTIVWKASGHIDRFVDIIADSDGKKYRIEKVIEEQFPTLVLKEKGLEALTKLIQEQAIIPKGNKEKLHNAREYNLMLTTSVAETSAVLRPETATTTYLAFKDYFTLFRGQMPIKVFQYGRVFRNEITSKQGLIKGREFEQCEGQMFILDEQKNPFADFSGVKHTELRFLDSRRQQAGMADPQILALDDMVKNGVLSSEAFGYCFSVVSNILRTAGIKPKSVRFRQHLPDEKAHYALDAWDVEVATDQYGWVEVCGVHDRGDYDLGRHQQFSGKNLTIQNAKGENKLPHILEIAFGVGRTEYCMLEQNFSERDGKNVLFIPRRIAPIQAGVFPLINKEGLEAISEDLDKILTAEGFTSFYDSKGSIGRRYARMDELGTPYCFTIDFQTKTDGTVTLRDRDTTQQERISLTAAPLELYKRLLI